MTSNNIEQPAIIGDACGRGGWCRTYAQALVDTQEADQREPEPLPCADEQMAALRAVLRAATADEDSTGIRYRNRPCNGH